MNEHMQKFEYYFFKLEDTKLKKKKKERDPTSRKTLNATQFYL